MLSLPFNSSTPVLWYNKDAFKKAGLDPNAPPARPGPTWKAPRSKLHGRRLSLRLHHRLAVLGHARELLSAWHNVPFATKENGFAGLDTELTFNSEPAACEAPRPSWASWQKSKIFDYGGRRSESAPKFYQPGMPDVHELLGLLRFVKKQRQGLRVRRRHAALLDDDVASAPQNSIIGGATLWVLRGHEDPEEYKGVAKFFNYLSSAEVQADWHQSTGYLPITTAAWELTKEAGLLRGEPGHRHGDQADDLQPADENSKGLRLRQLRADPRHHQRRAGSHLGRLQDG